jgi:signal transduction histidine kinase
LEGEHNTTINIDTQHLQEILNNIISNAENSIPDNREGMITCGISTQDNSVIIEVQDNGVGIKPEIIENIFDPKFSVNSSQTGLGLPICKRIIEFYNGQLSFETAEAEGTSFFISFPNSDN